MIGKSISEAKDDVEKQIINKEMNELREQIKLINENFASSGFLIDLALNALVIPLSGYLAIGIASKFLGSMANKRSRDIKFVKQVVKERRS